MNGSRGWLGHAGLGAAAVLGVSISACHGGNAGTGGTGGATTTVSAATKTQVCTAYATAYCAELEACNPFYIQTTYGDAATCASRNEPVCVAAFDLPGFASTPDALTACAAALGAQSCEDMFAGVVPAPCDVRGTLADAASCSHPWECKGGDCYVNHNFAGDCGLCTERTKAGDDCEHVPCDVGFFCNSNVCQKDAAKGEACDAGLGPSCSGAYGCVDGVCDTPLGMGAACKGGDCDIDHGLVCTAGSPGPTCAPAMIAQANESCASIEGSGAPVYCAAGSVCFSDACQPNLADGAVCNDPSVSGFRFCSPPAICVGDDTCRLTPSVCE